MHLDRLFPSIDIERILLAEDSIHLAVDFLRLAVDPIHLDIAAPYLQTVSI